MPKYLQGLMRIVSTSKLKSTTLIAIKLPLYAITDYTNIFECRSSYNTPETLNSAQWTLFSQLLHGSLSSFTLTASSQTWDLWKNISYIFSTYSLLFATQMLPPNPRDVASPLKSLTTLDMTSAQDACILRHAQPTPSANSKHQRLSGNLNRSLNCVTYFGDSYQNLLE